MTLARIILAALVATAIARGEDRLTLRMEPGCFTGPPRSLLTGSSADGAWIQYANEEREWNERNLIGTKEEVGRAFTALRKVAFSETEKDLLAKLNRGIIGPGSYTLKITLDDQTHTISYLADMTIPGFSEVMFNEDERFVGKKKLIRSVLTKVRMIHDALAPLIPNKKPNKAQN